MLPIKMSNDTNRLFTTPLVIISYYIVAVGQCRVTKPNNNYIARKYCIFFFLKKIGNHT